MARLALESGLTPHYSSSESESGSVVSNSATHGLYSPWNSPGQNTGGSAGKESACSVGILGLIPGWGRSPGEGKGYPVQYSGLEKSTDCVVHGVTESDITE